MTSRPMAHDLNMTSDDPGGLAEGVVEIALMLAEALHRVDPQAAREMNFACGLAYNRFLREHKTGAADLMLTFGRALTDHERFPPAGADRV